MEGASPPPLLKNPFCVESGVGSSTSPPHCSRRPASLGSSRAPSAVSFYPSSWATPSRWPAPPPPSVRARAVVDHSMACPRGGPASGRCWARCSCCPGAPFLYCRRPHFPGPPVYGSPQACHRWGMGKGAVSRMPSLSFSPPCADGISLRTHRAGIPPSSLSACRHFPP